MTDAQLPVTIDNNQEPDEPLSAIPDLPSNDSVEDTPPNDSVEVALPCEIVESETVKTDKTIFVTIYPFLNPSAFEQLGLSVFIIQSNNLVPKDYYEKNLNKIFILAFDNNDDAIGTIKESIECFKLLGIENYKIALPPHDRTWHDLNLSGQLAADTIEKTLNSAYLQGQLFFATSALDYFNRYREQHPDTKTLIFEFDKRLYKGSLKKVQSNSDDEPTVVPLTDCRIQLRYSVIDESKSNKRRIEHHIELYSEREGYNQIIITDVQLTQLNAFKIALQKHRQLFYGNSKDLTELTSYLFETNPPKVRALSAIGYDYQSQGYFFPEFAYDVSGQLSYKFNYFIHTINSIQPFMNCTDTVIKIGSTLNPTNVSEQTKGTVEQFINLLNGAYLNKGLLAFGFYISSLFRHKIVDHYGFFPILSLYGNPSPYVDDKKFLSRLFNRCLFIDSEGQKMKADFTVESELKKIRQKSNLVCALLDDRNYKKAFDYDTVLPFYNRKALSSNATLAFLSNTERFTTDVIKDFVISLQFPNTDSEQPNSLREQLNSYIPEQLANVGHYLLSNRQYFDNRLLNNIITYEGILTSQGITVQKIAQNYAIALGGITCLLQLLNNYLPLINNLENYTLLRARHKHETTRSSAYLAHYFLKLINTPNLITKGITTGIDINLEFYSENNDKQHNLIIDLPTVLKQLRMLDFDFNEKMLSAALKEHSRYLNIGASFDFGTTRRAYFFEKE
jgi:hypothetical protein